MKSERMMRIERAEQQANRLKCLRDIFYTTAAMTVLYVNLLIFTV